MRYRLRTLLILVMAGPPILAAALVFSARIIDQYRTKAKPLPPAVFLRSPPVLQPVVANPEIRRVPTISSEESSYELIRAKLRRQSEQKP